jgi:hypothetical protein
MKMNDRIAPADTKNDWKKTNRTWEAMTGLQNRTHEIIDGTGSKKLVIAYGTP